VIIAGVKIGDTQRIGIFNGRIFEFPHCCNEVGYYFIVEDNICCLIINDNFEIGVVILSEHNP